MLKKLVPYLLTVVIIALLTIKCANVTSPTGGPKDTIPPQLIQTVPLNQTKNFRGEKLILEFNEDLKLSNLKSQLIITPRVSQDIYDYKIRRNKIIIELLEALDDSTTYTFNFNESITDATEGNIAPPVIFTFSTGPYLDSMEINGQVNDLLTNQPIDKATIAIYDTNDTLNFINSEPLYFTKSNSAGYFTLQNLKNSSYKIYAFLDQNNDLQINLATEKYGFLSQTIDPLIQDTLKIPVQQWNMDSLQLLRYGQSGKYFNVNYNKPLRSLHIRNSTRFPYQLTDDLKTVRFFSSEEDFNNDDSTLVILEATDSSSIFRDDSVYIRFNQTKQDYEEFIINPRPQNSTRTTTDYYRTFKFNKPLQFINYDSIYIAYDTIPFISFSPSTTLYDTLIGTITFSSQLDPIKLEELYAQIKTLNDSLVTINSDTAIQNTPNRPQIGQTTNKLKFVMRTASLISIENDTSLLFEEEFTILQSDETGIIRGVVETSQSSFIVQLYNEVGIIQELKNARNYTFDNLLPGTYNLRILIDSNLNNEWDRGNILQDEEPEPIIFYPESIPVKANWEIENEIIRF